MSSQAKFDIPEAPLARSIRVLVAEGSRVDADSEVQELRRSGIVIEERLALNEDGYRDALEHFRPDVILCGFAFPAFDGLSALKLAQSKCPEVPFIFVTGAVTEESLVRTLQSGATDYVLRSNLLRLPNAVSRAVNQAKERCGRLSAEAQVVHLSAVRDVSVAVNAAIIRQCDYALLFREVCRIAAKVGRLPFAAIFLHDGKTNHFEIVACEGAPISPELEHLIRDLSRRLPRPAGAAPDVISSKTAVVVNNLGQESSSTLRARLWRGGVRSVATFPLVVENAVIGAFIVASPENNFFDDEQVDLLANVSLNLSFALTFFNEHRRVARLSRIRDVLSAVNEGIVHLNDRTQLMREVCRIAFETAGYINVFVTLYDQRTEQLTIPVAMGPSTRDIAEVQQTLQQYVHDRRGITSRALRTLKPAILNDLHAASDDALSPKLREDGVRAVGVFPFVVDGRIGGAIAFHTAEANYFDDEEIHLLASLTNNLAFALDHIHRQERVARLSRIRDMLSAVNTAIVRFNDRNDLFQEVCRIAVEAGGFLNVFVAELNPETGGLEIPALVGESDRGELLPPNVLRLADRGRPLALLESSILSLQPVVFGSDLPHASGAYRRGARAVASFPLVIDGRGIGAMIFETRTAGYFDAEEVELLSNLANNLAFGQSLFEKRQRLRYLSFYDVLSRLPNRALFYERLGQDLAAAKRAGKMLGLVLLDISRFSVLNNTLGEHVGDEALRIIADRLRGLAEERYIARVAGDRFALCFPMLQDLQVMTELVNERGLTIFDEPFHIGARVLDIVARAGCVVAPNDGDNPEKLFRNAEAALQKAKMTASGYRFYAPELNARLARELDIEARLRLAIAERRFTLFYQPKVDLLTREVVGFEALLRWNDMERGVVLPDEFIPFLERTGTIVPVGRWALCEAAQQYERWRKAGLRPPRIAVNLSVVQLRNERLVDDVRAAVAIFSDECGLDVEVTESMLMEDFDAATHTLNAIRDLGVYVALDDFGTGYSSLSYLHRLPLNALKIDRSFINGMLDDANKRSIVSTIVSLGQSLSLKIIAEGVEGEGEAQLLHLLRCDQVQGYLFGRPEPADVAARFLYAGPLV